MTNRLRFQVLIAVLLTVFLTVSTGAPAHAAKISFIKNATSTQTAPKPTAGPYQGEPDVGQSNGLPPKDGFYTTGGGLRVSASWVEVWRALLQSLLGRLR